MANLIQKKGKAIGNQKPDLSRVWKIADSVGRGTKIARKAIKSDNPMERFWALIALRNDRSENLLFELAATLLDDPNAEIRIEAASWLAVMKPHRDQSFKILIKELDNPTWAIALRACRAIELLGNDAKPAIPAMKKVYARTRNTPGDDNFFLAFSSGAFLQKLGEKTTPWDFTPGAGSFMPTKKK